MSNNNNPHNISVELVLTIQQLCQDFVRNTQSVLGRLDPQVKEKAADILLNELDDWLDQCELIVNGELEEDTEADD